MSIPLAITIRSENGQFHKMAQKSDEIMKYLADPKFLIKEPDHATDFIKKWAAIRAEWLKGKDQQTSSRQMEESTYCGSDDCMLLAPQSHGLILIDYVTNTIHSMQTLLEIGRTRASTEENIKRLFNAEKLIGYIDVTSPSEVFPIPESLSAEEELKIWLRKDNVLEIVFDTAPWKVINYIGDEKSLDKAKPSFRAVIEKMIPLSETEQAAWG